MEGEHAGIALVQTNEEITKQSKILTAMRQKKKSLEEQVQNHLTQNDLQEIRVSVDGLMFVIRRLDKKKKKGVKADDFESEMATNGIDSRKIRSVLQGLEEKRDVETTSKLSLKRVR
jgi:hypothetical protein